MGFQSGPLAAGAGMAAGFAEQLRRSGNRANMMALVDLVARQRGGGFAGALAGARDDQSAGIRQVAIYVAHTMLGMRKIDCAQALGLSKWCATRAIHAVETRRADPAFNAQLEQLEAVIRRWLTAARTIEIQTGPVPPTQGPLKRPVAASHADTGGAAPVADLSFAPEFGRRRA